jgi:hypothetical protein
MSFSTLTGIVYHSTIIVHLLLRSCTSPGYFIIASLSSHPITALFTYPGLSFVCDTPSSSHCLGGVDISRLFNIRFFLYTLPHDTFLLYFLTVLSRSLTMIPPFFHACLVLVVFWDTY